MTKVPYLVAEKDGQKTVTAYINGVPHIASKSNPNFDRITEKLFEEDYHNLAALFNVEQAIENKFKKISERVSVKKGKVYFDNDAIENSLSDHLLRLIHDGKTEDDVKYLVNFWEKIATNPSEHSRVHLLRWLNTHDFSITIDGDIVAYKGLLANGTSIHAGPGIVNGVEMNGHLPNEVGNILEISREKVVADSARGCAFGLHVGTHAYASSWSGSVGRVVEVTVNPRDVVSVPTDCGDAKVRVCRYTVQKVQEGRGAKREEAVVDYSQDDDFATDESSNWQNVGYTTTDWNSI